MDREGLCGLQRKELQALAKEHGIKANKKSAELIEELLVVLKQPTPEKKDCDNSLSVEPVALSVDKERMDAVVNGSTVSTECTNDEALQKACQTIVVLPALSVGMKILYSLNNTEESGMIKRLNKKSVRVVRDNGSEVTVVHENIIGEDKPEDSKDDIQRVVSPKNQESSDSLLASGSLTKVEISKTPNKSTTATKGVKRFSLEKDVKSTDAELNLAGVSSPQVVKKSEDSTTPCTSTLKRASLIKTTKAQRARAEAIAHRMERVDNAIAAANHTPHKARVLASAKKSEHKRSSIQVSGNIHSSMQKSECKRISLQSTSNDVPVHSAPWNASFRSTSRSSVASTEKIDRIAIANAAKEAANNYLSKRSSSVVKSTASSVEKVDRQSVATAAKTAANNYLSQRNSAHKSTKKVHKSSSTKVPNFKKLHEKNFNSQKAITSIVKPNEAVRRQMSENLSRAMNEAAGAKENMTPASTTSSGVSKKRQEHAPAGNPFKRILSKPSSDAPIKALEKHKASNRDNVPSKSANTTSSTTKRVPLHKKGISNDVAKENRREKFLAENKVLRKEKINTARGLKAAPKSTF
mmetsp:Transcript_2990/g.4535  ORF Transcript_2990/g.4535 Transcript_2990/m.4535 type:complete len:581 (-) Transcript_2990:131-1873(-)